VVVRHLQKKQSAGTAVKYSNAISVGGWEPTHHTGMQKYLAGYMFAPSAVGPKLE
jgi:hypothetical protein